MRLYDGTTVVDWNVDSDAVVCPLDPALRAKWGWQQDADGRWYRDLADREKIGEPVQPQLV